VPDAYFREVVANLRGRVTIILIRIGGQLASFSILLEEKNRIIGKYIGMRYPLAREHNVYFLNWMLVVRHCIEKRAEWLQVGQTTYRQKARLGCKLRRSWCRHRTARRALAHCRAGWEYSGTLRANGPSPTWQLEARGTAASRR